MAILLANKDGTSNAKPGDVVVTGGGIFRKNEDGTSTKMQALPTYGGKTSDYNIVTNIWREMTGTGGDYIPTNTAPKAQSPVDQVLNDTTVFDSYTNYDSFTTPGTGSAPVFTGSKINFGNLFGYIIVGLVLLVILDKLMMGGGK